MKKKMGRPKLPKSAAKSATQIGVRLNPEEAAEVAARSKETGQTAAEMVRQNGAPAPVWVRTDWTVQELHDKWIRCHLPFSGSIYEITGRLLARMKPSGEKSIKVQVIQGMGYNSYRITDFHLTQEIVDRIVRTDGPGNLAFTALLTDV